jgi:hypothetical protein
MRYTENIEGNDIYSYEVDIRNGRLTLRTQSQDGRQVAIRFSDVLAHDFENVKPDRNVMRDIETLELPQFMKMYKDEMPGWLAKGLPVEAGNGGKKEKKLRKTKLRIYVVNSAEGLSGVVFARDMDIT